MRENRKIKLKNRKTEIGINDLKVEMKLVRP